MSNVNTDQGSFIELTAWDCLRSPLWIVNPETARIRWANSACFTLIGIEALDALTQYLTPCHEALVRQWLASPSQPPWVVTQSLDLPGKGPVALTLQASPLPSALGSGWLVEGVAAIPVPLGIVANQALSILDHSPDGLRLYYLNGEFLWQNAIAAQRHPDPQSLPDDYAHTPILHDLLAHLQTSTPYSTEFEQTLQAESRWIALDLTIIPGQDPAYPLALIREKDRTEHHQQTTTQQNLTAKLTFMIQATTDGFWEWDLRQDHVLWSTSFYRLLGLDQEMELSFDVVQALVHPDDADRHQRVVQEYLQTGGLYQIELRMRHQEGHYLWILAQGASLRDGEQILGMAGTIQNITEQKRHEALLMGQKKILQAIVTDVPLTKILTDLILVIESQLSDLRGAILIYDPASHTLQNGVAPSLSPAYSAAINGLPVAENQGSCGTAAHRREPVIVADIATHPAWENSRKLALKYDLQAAWSMPILTATGDLLGTFCFYAATPRHPTVAERQLLWEATHLAGIALERQRAKFQQQESEQALRQSEQRFRHLFEEVPSIAVQGYDRDRRVIFWNRASEKLYGYSAAEALGQRLEDLLGLPDQREVLVAFMDDSFQNPTVPRSQEVQLRTKTGAILTVYASAVLIPNLTGELELYCLDVDYSDRARAAQALRESEARARETSQMLTHFSRNLKELHRLSTHSYNRFAELCKAYLTAGCQLLNLPVGMILQIQGGHCHLDSFQTEQPSLSVAVDGLLPLSRIYEQVVIFERRTQISTTAETATIHPLAPHLPIATCISTPIQIETGIYGILSFASPVPRQSPFMDHEQEILELMARDLGRFIMTYRSELHRQSVESALRHSEMKYRSIFENINQGIFQTTLEGRYLDANPFLARLYGYRSPMDLIRNLTNIGRQLYVNPSRRWELIQKTQTDGMIYHEESQVYRRDRTVIWIAETQRAVYDNNGNLLYFEGTVEDITARRHAEAELHYNAYHDPLTQLHNRTWFTEQLQQAIAAAPTEAAYPYAVLFIDLDRFKIINDGLGHIVGDHLLKAVAQRLRDSLTAPAKLARFGGDEFAVLLENLDPEAVKAIATHLVQQMQCPICLDQRTFSVCASIGIVFSDTATYERPDQLLRDADLAMYRAKGQGGNSYACFEPSMFPLALTRLNLEHDIKRALELQELQLHYQPIMDLKTHRVYGFEVLLRWCHGERGWITPDEFIPVAEETGEIQSIGLWVLEQSCRQLAQWRSQIPAMADLVLTVNVSPVQLKYSDLVDRIQHLLDRFHLPPTQLKLEITETGFLAMTTVDCAIFQQMRDLGVGLCIDDFGTGYSSLSRLHTLPISTIKVDRSFVNDIDTDDAKVVIAQTIIDLAHNIGTDVVSEGIETEAQRDTVLALGCELGQGYWFSRPMDAERAERWFCDRLP
ncbi:EAL domain-containing protein [Spirulina subsalsa]|uniref:sensor domain-containing phosphodiesterase n=1 Tax=Spirulina subsalsa TaxID=54311 RepID=UPI00232DDD05|nr:EAL domain-containing protein [Spirulina subsalsa]